MRKISEISRFDYHKFIGKKCTYINSSNSVDNNKVYIISNISKKYVYITPYNGTGMNLQVKKHNVALHSSEEDNSTNIATVKFKDSAPKWIKDLRKEYKYLIPSLLSNIGEVKEWDIEEDDGGDILHYKIGNKKFSKQIKDLANELI